MPRHIGGRACKCIQCNMRRKGVTPGRRRRIKRTTNPNVTVFRGNPGSGEVVEVYRGVAIIYRGGHYYPDVVSATGGNVSMPRMTTLAAVRRFVGFALKRGAKARPRQNPGASAYVAQEMHAMKHGSAHVRTPKQAVAVGLARARAAGIRVKRNPAASRVAFTLSTRALDLSYLHAEDKKHRAYRHKFARGVTIQLLTDGTVRLIRADGRPLWKNFTD